MDDKEKNAIRSLLRTQAAIISTQCLILGAIGDLSHVMQGGTSTLLADKVKDGQKCIDGMLQECLRGIGDLDDQEMKVEPRREPETAESPEPEPEKKSLLGRALEAITGKDGEPETAA